MAKTETTPLALKFHGSWLSRPGSGGERYRAIQVHSDPRWGSKDNAQSTDKNGFRVNYSTKTGKCGDSERSVANAETSGRSRQWCKWLEGKIPRLRKIWSEFKQDTPEMMIDVGFTRPGSTRDSLLSFHITIPHRKIPDPLSAQGDTDIKQVSSGFTEHGEQLISTHEQVLIENDGLDVVDTPVDVDFFPESIVAFPVITQEGTVHSRLKEPSFCRLSTREDGHGRTLVVLLRVVLSGSVIVRSKANTEGRKEQQVLYKADYEEGKFGNPHLTMASQFCSLESMAQMDGWGTGKPTEVDETLRGLNKNNVLVRNCELKKLLPGMIHGFGLTKTIL